MSIATALFTNSQTQVLRWLFGQPGRGYHLNELLRLTGLGSASLQRELKKLSDAGLVRSERVGTLRRFKANADSPVYKELVALTRKTLGIDAMLKDALEPMASKLEAAFMFGSVAKGTDDSGSDIDLMLVGKNLLLSKVLELLIPLETKLGRKINPTLLTPAEFQRRRTERDSFVNRVLAQPTLPLIGDVAGPSRARQAR